MRKIFTLLTFGLGFLLGSKAGRKPYDKFMEVMHKIRQTNIVSRPIEATANKAADMVRSRGNAMTDHWADATYRSIAGSGPSVEAQVIDVYDGQ